jgi:hypothetical protein
VGCIIAPIVADVEGLGWDGQPLEVTLSWTQGSASDQRNGFSGTRHVPIGSASKEAMPLVCRVPQEDDELEGRSHNIPFCAM